jgi:RNA polymerase sigma factor (sigma-70 family)
MSNLAPWVASHGPGLRRYFARRAPRDDVDDLVQEVYLRMQALRPRGPIRDMERYLFTVARHVLVDRKRTLAAHCSALHDCLDDVPEPVSDLSPERIVSARQDYDLVMAAVRGLPPRARAAFHLHQFEDLSYAAIAERMAISRDSVKELLHRAVSRVRGAHTESSILTLAKSSRTHPPCRNIGASL